MLGLGGGRLQVARFDIWDFATIFPATIKRGCMMISKSVKTYSLVFLCVGLLFNDSPSATANLITQTFTFGMAGTDWINNLNIAQIDLAAGGILNDVTITETVDWTAYLAGTNTDHTSSVKVTKNQADLQLYDSITGPSTPLFDQSIGYNNHSGITLAPGTGYSFGNFVSTNSFAYDYAGAGNTSQFVGSGFLPLQVSTFTQNNESTTGGGRFTYTQDTRAALQVQVTYDYTGHLNTLSVPEPSVWFLLGVGGVICLGWRRKTAGQN